MAIDRNDFAKSLRIVPDDPNEDGCLELCEPEPQDYDDYSGAVACLVSTGTEHGWIIGAEDATALANALLKLVAQHD